MVQILTTIVEHPEHGRMRVNRDPVTLAKWRRKGWQEADVAPQARGHVEAEFTTADLARDAERFAEKDAAEAEADSADEPAKKGRGRGRKGAA